MKGITYCGECADYDHKKHHCKRGANRESNPQDKFYDDCPLPDVEPVGWISVRDKLPEPEVTHRMPLPEPPEEGRGEQ